MALRAEQLKSELIDKVLANVLGSLARLSAVTEVETVNLDHPARTRYLGHRGFRRSRGWSRRIRRIRAFYNGVRLGGHHSHFLPNLN